MKRLSCIVGEQHEPYEAGCPQGKTPYILPTAKYIVRVNNKKDTRKECLIFGHAETLLHRRRATRALRGRMPAG